ncbi:hypothetical protein [Spirosoma knui]
MKTGLIVLSILLMRGATLAQTKPAAATPPAIVSIVESVTGKDFEPDTAYAALSDEDKTLLAKEPVANWGLPQESGNNMMYYNLIIGTRSYQLVIVKSPKVSLPTATLLRFTDPKSKPEPIARGTLKSKEEKAK